MLNWETAFGVPKVDLEHRTPEDAQFQRAQWEFLTTEFDFIMNLNIPIVNYGKAILISQPQLMAVPGIFVIKVFGEIEELQTLHERHLFRPLLESWERGGCWASFDERIFVSFAQKALDCYKAFTSTYDDRVDRMRDEVRSNPKFRTFCDIQIQASRSGGLTWEHHLRAPILRYQRQALQLASLARLSPNRAIKIEVLRAAIEMKQLARHLDQQVLTSEQRRRLTHFRGLLVPHPVFDTWLKQDSRRLVRHGCFPCTTNSTSWSSRSWTYQHIVCLDKALMFARLKDGYTTTELAALRKAGDAAHEVNVPKHSLTPKLVVSQRGSCDYQQLGKADLNHDSSTRTVAYRGR